MTKPPNSAIKAPRKAKQLRPKATDKTLPTYTTPGFKYLGIEGRKPGREGLMQSVGNREGFSPHLRSMPIRSLSGPHLDPSFRVSKTGLFNPVFDTSIVAARPFNGMSKLGMLHSTRYHHGNSDFKQKNQPIIYTMGGEAPGR